MRITGGPSRGRKIDKFENESTRPPLVRMRKSLFSILGDAVEGARVLDLFAGSGAFGIEALSRGARSAIFVEACPRTAEGLRQNLRKLGFRSQSEVFASDAFTAMEPGSFLAPHAESSRVVASTLENGLDLVFLDPPFAFLEEGREREDLLRGLMSLQGCPRLDAESTIVFRAPIEHPLPPELAGNSSRTYGRSVVHFLSPHPAPDPN